MNNKILHFFQWLLLTLFLLNAVPWLTANWFMFQPPKPIAGYQAPITLTTVSGQEITAEYFAHPKAKWTILYSHGNATDLARIRGILKELRAEKYNVLSYEYPGYGGVQGRPSERGTYEATEAAYAYLIEQLHVRPCQVVIFGRSLGSGPSVDLAKYNQVAGMILISPMLSAYRVLTYIPLLMFDRYKNAEKIVAITMPLLIVHGDIDIVEPIWHGKKLFQIANSPKQSLWLVGYGHNDIFSSPQLMPKINAFMRGLKGCS